MAIRDGTVTRLRRGHYGLPGLARSTVAAERVGGVCSHLTAALLWEWPVAWQPERPVVTVPRWRRLTPERREGIDVRWANLDPDEIYRQSPIRCDRPGLWATALGEAFSRTSAGLTHHCPQGTPSWSFACANRRTGAVIGAAAILAVATGGGAVAGSMVSGAQIEDGTIEAVDLAPGAVNSSRVTTSRCACGLPSSVRTDPRRGPQGPQGEPGPAGPPAPPTHRRELEPGRPQRHRRRLHARRSGPARATAVHRRAPVGVGSLVIRSSAGSTRSSASR